MSNQTDCPDCRGAGQVVLFTSAEPCERSAGGARLFSQRRPYLLDVAMLLPGMHGRPRSENPAV